MKIGGQTSPHTSGDVQIEVLIWSHPNIDINYDR